MEITHKRLAESRTPEMESIDTGVNVSNSGLQSDGTYINNLPILTLAEDSVEFAVEGFEAPPRNPREISHFGNDGTTTASDCSSRVRRAQAS